MGEIFKLIMQIIIDLITNKAKGQPTILAGDDETRKAAKTKLAAKNPLKSAKQAEDCWNTPAGRLAFVHDIIFVGLEKGTIADEMQALEVLEEIVAVQDDVLMPIRIELLYKAAIRDQ